MRLWGSRFILLILREQLPVEEQGLFVERGEGGGVPRTAFYPNAPPYEIFP